ncbi:hypothetical protein WR25_23796 [Diploscapter pachys]|uniref:Receptor ligand binding region domain-containing protein n=1 Tax=Diploscapter pachys TaxID=2018661 RepID=A0A2A2LSP4_9BILA|nr:hypothetical protein WR25_23796 [Diploscapter pachys]
MCYRFERLYLIYSGSIYRYSSKLINVICPVFILIPLPQDDHDRGGKNPFRLSIPKIRPVVDLAIEQVYRLDLVPANSLYVIYRDTKLSDAVGPNVAIEQYKKNQLDCIIGYAFVYALAPIARITRLWGNGVPIITPVGMTNNLDDKGEYRLMTRINTPYKLMCQAVLKVFDHFEWKKHTFVFHTIKDPGVPVSECFLLLSSVKQILKDLFPALHNFFPFDEHKLDREEFIEILKQSSFISNALHSKKSTFNLQPLEFNRFE